MADLDAIYRQNADIVYRFLLAKTGSFDLAEELTQETFFRAVGSIGNYDGSCEEPASKALEETIIEKEGQEGIFSEIHKLPEHWRELMYLRLLGGLSYKQIGSVLQQSETWVRVNYYRAKQTLIKELEKHG